MINFKMNGKDLSNEDICAVISRDSVTDKTEISFFTDKQEVVLDNSKAIICVDIDIACDDETLALVDESHDIDVKIGKTRHAIAIAKGELDSLTCGYYNLVQGVEESKESK